MGALPSVSHVAAPNPVRGNLTLNDDEALWQAVLGGLGISLLPTFIVGKDLQTRRLQGVLTGRATLFGDRPGDGRPTRKRHRRTRGERPAAAPRGGAGCLRTLAVSTVRAGRKTRSDRNHSYLRFPNSAEEMRRQGWPATPGPHFSLPHVLRTKM